MKSNLLLFAIIFFFTTALPCLPNQQQAFGYSTKSVKAAFGERKGCFVVTKCSSGKSWYFNKKECLEKLPPCSTFKIWNTLIGLSNGEISSADEPFYKWDGITRQVPSWNKDLTLKEAFQASCVPAFQQLAREVGPKTMKAWIDKINYGDRDISAGIDAFWLPDGKKKTILITPQRQAELIRSLLLGKLPFSQAVINTLKDLMFIDKTKYGTLYGKTGGSDADGVGYKSLGWFVGFVESDEDSYAFACVVKDTKGMGAEAREIVKYIFENEHLF